MGRRREAHYWSAHWEGRPSVPSSSGSNGPLTTSPPSEQAKCQHQMRVYGVGEDGVPAFTEYGIECLKQIIADKRAAGGAPPPIRSTK